MFANAEMKISGAIFVGLKITGAFESKPRFCRRREIGGAAEKPRQTGRDRIQNSSRGVSTGDSVRIGSEDRDVFVPSFGQVAALHPFALIGKLPMGTPVALEQGHPVRPQLFAAGAEFPGEVLVHAFRN